MPQTPRDPLLEALLGDFGANSAVALDILEQYRADRLAVEPGWRAYFDARLGVAGGPGEEAPPPSPAAPGVPTRQEAALERTAGSATVPAPSRALVVPVLLPGDVAEPIRGGALRLAENMAASLAVPTATSVREIPVRTLEENRQALNRHRAARGLPKLSFTHLLAWAVLRALDSFPRLNDAYAELEGRPHRVHRDEVRLGLAVDVPRRDGSRALLVPNVRQANRLRFPELVAALEDVVGRARRGQASPDDFLGTTVSLTNPGTVGTTTSAPRLMPGQGLIVAAGALDYPAEYRSMVPRTLSLLGISKVMTITSTYDHRIVQGAESGLFLARVEELLRGEDGFWERLFDELEVPHRPLRWEVDSSPGLLPAGGSKEEVEKQARVLQLVNAYRVRGHLVADLDPLDDRRAPHPDLDPATYGLTVWDLDREFFTNGALGKDRARLREILEVLRDTYCGTVGVEYMFIADKERKEWLQERLERRDRGSLDEASRRRVLEKLVEAEAFERLLHARYVGHKRFSLEGCEAVVPFLDRLLTEAARGGVREVVLGMSHRGRLNVLANTVGKPLARIFSEFEGDVDPDSVQGSGDVKYHLGATGVHRTPTGETVAVTLAPNPSHLEFVNPVVEGMARARQDALGDGERRTVLPVLLHGDAAFAGQGVVAETLNLSGLDGYRTGGTVHLVVNNQIGFTTSPRDARSSTYCTDVAKMVQAPVLHVSGDDAEAVARVASLAYEYRQRFRRDVVVDLVGYRRWGHNEGDEPSYTQPLMYARIKDHPSPATIYGEKLVRAGVLSREEVDRVREEKRAALRPEGEGGALGTISRRPPVEPAPVEAPVLAERIRTVLGALSSVPEGFEPHPKLLPLLRRRAFLLERGGDVDWATAELLAWGTLLLEGVPVRLSGQDSGRGTFSSRHAVLRDVRTGRPHVPLDAMAPPGVRFEVHDSLLSEAAVLGFEFGYAVADHRALVLWEAQFGDFANGAQVIIDQFLAGSEQKWGQPVGLTLLLPHGHEGQGPEHSSARIERFLTLCAEANLRVAYPSTPGSWFHLLRRQGRDAVERPLVVFTPKSLLRHPRCVTRLATLAEGLFEPVLDDEGIDPARVGRVVLTSGKLVYDLLEARDRRGAEHVAVLRLEQLYPVPGAEISSLLGRYPLTAELVWAQEEPRNMGAWRFLREQFLDGCVADPGKRAPRYVGRRSSAAPAPGSHKVHLAEQEAIVAEALAPVADRA